MTVTSSAEPTGSRSDALRDRLERFLGERAGGAVRVEGLRPLAGGASREIWTFEADLPAGATVERRELVLRLDPPGGFVRTSRRAEFEVLRAAAEAGVPVPRVEAFGEDPEVLGGPFLLMDRAPGEAIARRLLRDERYAATRLRLTADLGGALARIHAIDPARVPALEGPPRGRSSAEAEIDRYEALYRDLATEPHPAIELALRWLRGHLPPPAPLRVVHGDFRVGNVLFDERGLVAVLDWELARLGDPLDDLGWLCVRAWRFGNDRKPVGGVGEREELFAAYERAGGTPVDPARARFWELWGNAKWAIMCILQMLRHLDGSSPSVELASLGRRTAETEIELVELLEREG